MKTIVIAVILAVLLGVVVMLTPVLAFTYIYSTAEPLEGSGWFKGRGNNQTTTSADEYSLSRTPASIAEAAQAYGTLDADLTPVSSSLLHAVPVVATGLITAFAALFFLKKKNSQS